MVCLVDGLNCWKVAVLMGANKDTADEELWKVIEFETRIANISIDESDRHDTGQWYRKGRTQQQHETGFYFPFLYI
jgi:hypothetical protein